mgnify:CR=1 FL=1
MTDSTTILRKHTRENAMRVTYWGIRGSTAVFPTPPEVRDYTERVAVYTLQEAFKMLAEEITAGTFTLETIVKFSKNPTAIKALQEAIGLPPLPVYGGDTTCIEIETNEGNVFVIDGGSGVRHCAHAREKLWADKKDKHIHFLYTHEHLDHRGGTPFSRFCFAKQPYTITTYANSSTLSALDEQFGVFSGIVPKTHRDTPVDWRFMTAKKWNAVELRSDFETPSIPRDTPLYDKEQQPRIWKAQALKPFTVGRTTITPFDSFHYPTPCLAYKIEHDGKSVVIWTDHEMRRGPMTDQKKISMQMESAGRALCNNADLMYVDGQYFHAEYDGIKGIGGTPAAPRIGWGHSCIEDVLGRAEELGIKDLRIGHHDPEREYKEMLEIDEAFSKRAGMHVELAKCFQVIDL